MCLKQVRCPQIKERPAWLTFGQGPVTIPDGEETGIDRNAHGPSPQESGGHAQGQGRRRGPARGSRRGLPYGNVLRPRRGGLFQKRGGQDLLVKEAGFLSLIHISEPTRRTPISYAVFCLKKK